MSDEILEAIKNLTKAVEGLDATPHYSRKEYQMQMAPTLLQCAALKYVGTNAAIDHNDINTAIEMAGQMYDAIKSGNAIPEPIRQVSITERHPATLKTLNDLRLILNGLKPHELRQPVRISHSGIYEPDILFRLQEEKNDVNGIAIPKGSLIIS